MEAYRHLQTKFAEFQESLGDTLQELGDRTEQQHATERKLNDRNKRVKKWEDRVDRVQELERENGYLKQEIESLRSDLTGVDQDADAMKRKFREDPGDIPPDVLPRDVRYQNVLYRGCVPVHFELLDLYGQVYKDKTALIESYCVVASKLKRCKARFKQWESFLEQETIDTVVNGRKVVFRRVDDRGVSSSSNNDTTQEPVGQGQGQDLESPSLPRIPNASQRRPAAPATPAHNRSSGDDPSSTQSQDSRWPTNGSMHAFQSSSDTPTVTAARSVRKRGHGNNQTPANGARTCSCGTCSRTRPATVKSERSSSSAIRMAALASSSDGNMGNPGEHPSPGPDGNVGPPVVDPPVFEDSHGRRGADLEQSPRGRKRRALQPLDNNRVAPQRSDGRSVQRKKNESRGAAAVPSVAEDGDEDSQPRGQRSTPTTNNRNRTNPAGVPPGNRLQKLLGEPAGPKPILTPSPRSRLTREPQQNRSPAAGHESRTPAARQGSVNPTRTATPNTIPEPRSRLAPPSHSRSARPSAEDHEPYRSRPVHRLRLDHFKVNPERNQGLDYPFQEVVRNKDKRKCLSGCVRQDCCGPIFRSMAIEGRPGRPPITDSVSFNNLNREDRELLEEYLGDESGFIARMPNAELRSTLIDARAQELADLYGKHRHAHDRPRTPPGFWRTDMPDTQEQQRDRQLAKEMERVKVMERYREAMRPDGMWMFADE